MNKWRKIKGFDEYYGKIGYVISKDNQTNTERLILANGVEISRHFSKTSLHKPIIESRGLHTADLQHELQQYKIELRANKREINYLENSPKNIVLHRLNASKWQEIAKKCKQLDDRNERLEYLIHLCEIELNHHKQELMIIELVDLYQEASAHATWLKATTTQYPTGKQLELFIN